MHDTPNATICGDGPHNWSVDITIPEEVMTAHINRIIVRIKVVRKNGLAAAFAVRLHPQVRTVLSMGEPGYSAEIGATRGYNALNDQSKTVTALWLDV